MPLTATNAATLADLRSREAYAFPVTPSVELAPGDDIGAAIEKAAPGTHIALKPGLHNPIGKIEHCADGVTVMAEKKLQSRIKGKAGDTMYLDGPDGTYGGLTFRGVFFEGSERAVITTNSRDDVTAYHVNLEDCVIDGGYDHVAGRYMPGFQDFGDFNGLWGLNVHKHRGHVARTVIRNIHKQHGDYCHSPGGDRLYVDVIIQRCGRCAIQQPGRRAEAGYSDTQTALVRVYCKDNTIGSGGQQLTLGGTREFYLEDVECTFGQDAGYRNAYLAADLTKKRMGQGHFTCWDDKGRQDPTKLIEFAGRCYFANAPKCGNAQVMEMVNCEMVVVGGEFGLIAGDQPLALKLKAGTAIIPGNLTANPVIQGAIKYV